MPADPDDALESLQPLVKDQRHDSPELPEVVYVPAHPGPDSDGEVVRFETRCLPSGEAVGVAFRSRSALVEALGPAQPWLALPLTRLEVILGAAGIRRTLIDPPVDESAAWWTPERVFALAERLDGNHG